MKDFAKNNLKAFGFEEELKRVEKGLCPFCGKPVTEEDFKDEISKREFKISGMCQACQDDFFVDED